MATWTTTSDNSTTVWRIWVDSATTSGTNGSATNDLVWQGWITAGTTSSHITYHHAGCNPCPAPPPETEEQLEARLERQRQAELNRQRREEEQKAARQKAEELLRESLDEEQRNQFDKTKWFFVISQSGECYRIRPGLVGNIDELNKDNKIVAKYCIHPRISVPVEDSMLTQKLMLEADEARFLQIANKTTLRTPVAM